MGLEESVRSHRGSFVVCHVGALLAPLSAHPSIHSPSISEQSTSPRSPSTLTRRTIPQDESVCLCLVCGCARLPRVWNEQWEPSGIPRWRRGWPGPFRFRQSRETCCMVHGRGALQGIPRPPDGLSRSANLQGIVRYDGIRIDHQRLRHRIRGHRTHQGLSRGHLVSRIRLSALRILAPSALQRLRQGDL